MNKQVKVLAMAGCLAVVLLGGVSCKKDKSSTSAGAGAPPPAPAPSLIDPNGSWVGITSQGYSVQFAVSGDALQSFSATIHFSGVYCSGTSTATVTSLNQALEDRSFKYDSSALTFIGSFSTDDAAGTYVYRNSGCLSTDEVTWTAQKTSGAASARSQSRPGAPPVINTQVSYEE